MNLGALKSECRREMRARLKAIPATERAAASARACSVLREQAVWHAAKAVLFYAALPGELDLAALMSEALAEGKTVALPRFMAETQTYGVWQIRDVAADCGPGKFGILEPAARGAAFPLKHLDFALVPGLGFDRSGHRLGRGQGYYDRLLAGMDATKCGVGFDEQVVGALPAEPHDIRMNFILTPTEWLRTIF